MDQPPWSGDQTAAESPGETCAGTEEEKQFSFGPSMLRGQVSQLPLNMQVTDPETLAGIVS
jgi:hypothetical protein